MILKSSDKGEEAFNPEVIAPLEDVSDGSSMEEVLEPSEWMRSMIKGFGTFVGFPIACCERQCIDFFQKLDSVWEQQATVVTTRWASNSN